MVEAGAGDSIEGVWDRSLADWFTMGGCAADHPCVVRITGKRMVVTYTWQGTACRYDGDEVFPGFYRLTPAHARGFALLHRRPDSPDVLEGTWQEDGHRGMWAVTLERRDSR